MKCNCKNVKIGGYDVTIPIVNPFTGKVVDIDICILSEINHLWWLGIETIESCCGHNKKTGYIAVYPTDIKRMLFYGYKIDKKTKSEGCFLCKYDWVLNKAPYEIQSVIENKDENKICNHIPGGTRKNLIGNIVCICSK